MTLVAVLTLAGLVALVVAVITGSTPVALGVIALAAVGIILLLRDWRTEQQQARFDADIEADDIEFGDGGRSAVSPDMFTPDISTDPDGPSADARAD
ncbi:MAG: hypothetical protein U0R81_00820 [Mycobacterium sp.]